ncbi:MAG: cysteine synthase A [Candidatus Riflebacteria bacterium]|nr:cysteine synthase A [Candidatus Riflebacteria bacterium]
MILSSILQAIGCTPLLRLARLGREEGCEILAKIESFNPGGSVKDRIALAMIEGAEREGKLRPGALLIEPTSGNTGIGLAMVAAVKGYRLILTMPETMSIERRKILAAYGAEIVLTPGAEGMKGAVRRAAELLAATPGAVSPSQFDNPHNPAAHERSTALEILEALEGKRVDAFVFGVGTGGTLTGIGRVIKARGMAAKLVAVEPAASPMLSEGRAGPHKIQGIGAGFVPGVLNRALVDEVVTVNNEEAMARARDLARHEGLLVGISSGAALAACLAWARRQAPAERPLTIVTLFPDTGERYLSTELFPSQG